MIQVAAENYSQEDFLGLGKKNKPKRQAKKIARQEKRAVKKEARQGKGLIGKIANRLGVSKQAKEVRKDFKTAKREIKSTGSFTRGSVRSGTIRTNPGFGGAKNGKIGTASNSKFINTLTGGSSTGSRPTRGTLPNERATLPQQEIEQPTQQEREYPSPPQPQESQEQIGQNALNPPSSSSSRTEAIEQGASGAAQASSIETGQGLAEEQVEKNEDGTPKKKPFNWVLWGGVGVGTLLVIGVIIYLVMKKK